MKAIGIAAALGMVVAAPAAAQSAESRSWVGEYVMSQMEAAAGLKLDADGTFQYGLTVGSLDERAKGRWRVEGDRIVLTSDPKPVAPTVTAGPVEPNPGQPFAIRLVGPNGRDVQGVDFTIDFDSGDPLNHYTRGEGWSLPAEEKRQPRFITFSMKQYRLQSPRLPIEARPGTRARFVLVPNDFGVADLTGSQVERQGDVLILHRPEGEMQFRRVKR